jgi:tRNA (cmo5U34)-methyltransferase
MSNAGDKIKVKNAAWSFKGKNLSKRFKDHIVKSVPLYNESHKLIIEYSDFFIKDGSRCYDIGCSVGNFLNSLSKHHYGKKCQFTGLDVQQDMINVAKKNYTKKNLRFKKANFLKIKCKKADMVVSFYTAQFIIPEKRLFFFKKIYKMLNWGGGLFLFEKIRSNDARFQDYSTAVYNEFKLKNGYNPDEIFQKTRSLKGVLEPFSEQGNIKLLREAGFKDYTTIFNYINFRGFLLIK